MIALSTVLKEQVSHIRLIFRVSVNDIKSRYQSHYLGGLWQFLNPLLQISVYWFVFGLGIRGGSPVGDVPFFLWLITGLIPWLYIAPVLNQGTKSISSKINMVSKMKFPVSILPTIAMLNNVVPFVVMMTIGIILVIVNGVFSGIYILQLPYYLLCMAVLVYSVTLLTATLSIVARDIQLVVQSIVRFMMFLLPILWNMSNLNAVLIVFLKLNPFFYIIEGVRASIIGHTWFFEDMTYTVYFWSIALLLLVVASSLHVKFRNHFVDLM
ncbi:ABC transporter permease [Lysinibacillus odysseyi]|uniref:Transport permease protein n=1 Tax=Lysinibacillus odysseyi 34hs-1 = NBRC 100172 TaxID=1220589 RepID=A0A0A3IUD6_9BACI|nr:ABC transporter permease [Lysinibacillus odysseyi]KGR86523.1 hypothetical protein CD32_06445 [Lysinibacillus odysseyi 34hs-1 = NBRC 100172]